MLSGVLQVSLFVLLQLSSASATLTTTCLNSTSEMMQPERQLLESRLRGALWAFFSGDALSSPSHWYYGGFPQISADYGPAGIMGYVKPKTQLRGSILNKSDVNGGGRSSTGGVSGGWFSKRKEKPVSIIGDVINHGKLHLWDPKKSIHYHATLERGENTLEVQLARVLMKSIVANGGTFNQDHFRKSYIEFMRTPGSHNDTYASTCHRMFFKNLVINNLPPEDCPDNDRHNVDTIDGLVLPTIVALALSAKDAYAMVDIETAAAECAATTRKSAQLEQASKVWSRLVFSALRDQSEKDFRNQLNLSAQDLGLRQLPRSHGPDQMTACYLSSSFPALLDMIAKYTGTDNGVWTGLLANANVGGENVHRGSVLGSILGARAGYNLLPQQLLDGLYDKDNLQKEIEDFISTVLKN